MDLRLLDTQFMRPMVDGWMGKIEAARTARSQWEDLADECLMFYGRSAAAMWNPEYSRKFWQGVKAPRFRITINKAFEFVAIYGPNLFWDTPYRMVTPKRRYELPPELFPDPMMAQIFQQTSMQEEAKDTALATLLGLWLNYTPNEQPGGGLREHGMRAVVDALVEGRGCLWERPYVMPGSGRTLTGCFREPPRNLYIDPDFNNLTEAKWIARRVVEPTWQVERRFQLPPGTLSDKASLESAWGWGEAKSNESLNAHRAQGQTNDLVVYYEVFSKTGAGLRKTAMQTFLKDHFEEILGDYAYIAVSSHCPFPLNCYPEAIKKGETDDQIRERFRWPIETWKDHRWPVSVLDFYPDFESAWPIPPLAAGIGELKFLNAMIPWLASRIWSSSRDFWVVARQHMNELERYLNDGADQTVIPFSGDHKNIKQEVVDIIQQPQTNFDVWKIIDLVSLLFDKRVGLTDFMYGMSDTQDRSALTTKSRMQMIGVRPDYMRSQVKSWMSEAAAKEAFIARLFITGEDTQGLLGQLGSQLWDQLVASEDVETVMRQFNYQISASSIQRPDRDKLAENAQLLYQSTAPLLDGHANVTGDTSPLNYLIEKLGESIDFDTDKLEMGPRVPQPPPPEQQAMVEQQMQHEQQMQQAEVEAKIVGTQADIAKAEMDIQAKREQMELDRAKAEMDIVQDAEQHAQEMQQQAQEFNLQMAQERAMMHQTLTMKKVEGEEKIKQQKQQGKAKLEQTKRQQALKKKAPAKK